jgi:hypothetical protein
VKRAGFKRLAFFFFFYLDLRAWDGVGHELESLVISMENPELDGLSLYTTHVLLLALVLVQ